MKTAPQKLFKPFQEGQTNNKFNWLESPDMYNTTGVYYLYDSAEAAEADQPVYVGVAIRQPIAKTISRHFQTWNDKDQIERIYYSAGDNWFYSIVDSKDVQDIAIFEQEEILRHNPRDNKSQRGWRLGTPTVDLILTQLAIEFVQGDEEVKDEIENRLFAAPDEVYNKFKTKVAEQEQKKLDADKAAAEAAEAAEIQRIQEENIFLTEKEAKEVLEREKEAKKQKLKKVHKDIGLDLDTTPF